MNKRKGYICTGLVLVLLAAGVSAALFVPRAVRDWYEEQALGQVEYGVMSYEPYDIRYYESFEEKLDAIAKRRRQGVQTYSMEIGERTDNFSDADLIEIANNELDRMFDAGLFPERLKIRSLLGRSFQEIYEIVNRDLEDETTENLRNVYFWRLECVTDYGTLMFDMDSEYHKIYSFAMHQEPHDGFDESWDKWCLSYMRLDGQAVAQSWIDYWELADAKPGSQNPFYEEQAADKQTDSGAMTVYIDLQSGNTVVLSVSVYSYYQKGMGIHWSLMDF